MRQGPGFGPRSSASARSSSGGGVRHAGSNPSEGSERSYDWSYVRSLSMLPSRPRLGPSPWRESSILNPGEAMWGPRNAYKVTAKRVKLLQSALAERDEAAVRVIRRIHKPSSLSDLTPRIDLV